MPVSAESNCLDSLSEGFLKGRVTLSKRLVSIRSSFKKFKRNYDDCLPFGRPRKTPCSSKH